MSTFPDRASVLTPDEAEELMQHLARLIQAGFPLAAGMRAAAAECEGGRVAESLRGIADRLDEGHPLPTILQDAEARLPHYVAGLMVAALRSGRLGDALLELVEQQSTARSLRRGLRQALAYPVTITALVLLWAGTFGTWLSYAWEQLIGDFQLPLATRHLLWWRDTGVWILGAAVVLIASAAWLYRRRRGEAAWSRLLSTLPLIGPLWDARGLAEWAGILSVLLRYQVPLPQALLWCSEGVQDAWMAERSRRWAEQSAAGMPMADALSLSGNFPSGLAPLIHWGERQASLAEAIATVRELLERRVRIRTDLLRTILPPILFVGIGCLVVSLAVALFMPMTRMFPLVKGLS